MIVVPTPQAEADLTALIAAGPPAGRLNGVKVHLFQNNIVPTPATILTDLVEATFDGYAASAAVTWGSVVVDPAGNAVVYGDAKTFTMTGSTTPNTVYGYYVTNSAGSTLEYLELFDSPVGFGGPGTTLVLLPAYKEGQLAA